MNNWRVERKIASEESVSRERIVCGNRARRVFLYESVIQSKHPFPEEIDPMLRVPFGTKGFILATEVIE